MNIPIKGEENWTPAVKTLLDLVIHAHQRSAEVNTNCSSAAVENAYIGSGSFVNAMCSGALTIGLSHGPISAARMNLEYGIAEPDKNGKVPGFGNSFFSLGDPAWESVKAHMESNFPFMIEMINSINPKPDKLLPNAAMWTAAACVLAKIPIGAEEMIFLLARIPIWANIITNLKEDS